MDLERGRCVRICESCSRGAALLPFAGIARTDEEWEQLNVDPYPLVRSEYSVYIPRLKMVIGDQEVRRR